MAEVNVKIKYKNGSVWDQVFPETLVDQIRDATTVGKQIFKASTPVSEAKFIKIDTSGNFSWRTAAEMRSDLGAAVAGHAHTIDDITGAVAALADKANLNGTVITASEIPSYITGGLKYSGVISTDIVVQTWLVGKLTTTDTSKGMYYIVTKADGAVITFDATVAFEAPGDEGDVTSPITLEAGDWLVFRGYESSQYKFAVINNTYQHADAANYGIGRISPTTVATRGQLSSSLSADNLVDEKVLRQVMKDIYYKDSETDAATAISGDLLLEF